MTGGRRLAIGLMGLSAIVCLPIAALVSRFLANAPNRWAVYYLWLWIFGAWLMAWLLLRLGLWMPACLLLAVLIGFFVYGFSQFDPP
jgi:hypothetical protein